MKKLIRVLGVTLSLVLLASCTPQETEIDPNVSNPLPVVTTSSIAGSYKVSIAAVGTAVDTNKDGVFNNYLLLEGYNSCEFDNIIEIGETTFSVIKKGVSCSSDEKNEIYEYKLDETAKTLELYSNGKVIETIKSVYLQNDNNIKELFYIRYDSSLNQNVSFKLTKI